MTKRLTASLVFADCCFVFISISLEFFVDKKNILLKMEQKQFLEIGKNLTMKLMLKLCIFHPYNKLFQFEFLRGLTNLEYRPLVFVVDPHQNNKALLISESTDMTSILTFT